MNDEGAAGATSRRRRPELDTLYTVNADGSRNFLHPADVRGRWQRRKNLLTALLIGVYAGLPWLTIGGRPAVLIDLPGRVAHLFGLTFTNQDFYLVFFLVSGLGFGLIVVTSLWGRVWCGYACPQTVFMEGVFRRVERALEGARPERIRRNLGPWTADKAGRKLVKHGLFLVLSTLIAHVFLSYFFPARELVRVLPEGPHGHGSAFFWTLFWTAVLYFNYSWFREQTCLIVCPYGRLQATLIDHDTVIIGYDARRGEPRHKGAGEGGDCVDCYRCVEVCPTGIDIRGGLQMECIGCANCIDACDEIMAKVSRPAGLVRYDSQRGLDGGARRFLRPRLFVYAALGLAGLLVAGFAAARREPFQVNVLRAPGLPFVLDEAGIRNIFTLHVQNKSDRPGLFTIVAEPAAAGPAGRVALIIPQARVRLDALADAEIPIVATLPRAAWQVPFPLSFAVTDSATGRRLAVKVVFRGP